MGMCTFDIPIAPNCLRKTQHPVQHLAHSGCPANVYGMPNKVPGTISHPSVKTEGSP